MYFDVPQVQATNANQLPVPPSNQQPLVDIDPSLSKDRSLTVSFPVSTKKIAYNLEGFDSTRITWRISG